MMPPLPLELAGRSPGEEGIKPILLIATTSPPRPHPPSILDSNVIFLK